MKYGRALPYPSVMVNYLFKFFILLNTARRLFRTSTGRTIRTFSSSSITGILMHRWHFHAPCPFYPRSSMYSILAWLFGFQNR